MNVELEQKLAKEFPFMLIQKDGNKEGAFNCFNCECDDGWFELIRRMCTEITKEFTERKLTVGFVPSQIKEKYGSLVTYYGIEFDEGTEEFTENRVKQAVAAITDKYEKISATVCERCGGEARKWDDISWLRTLCNEHHEEALQAHSELVKEFVPTEDVETIRRVEEVLTEVE